MVPKSLVDIVELEVDSRVHLEERRLDKRDIGLDMLNSCNFVELDHNSVYWRFAVRLPTELRQLERRPYFEDLVVFVDHSIGGFEGWLVGRVGHSVAHKNY